jgi:hypothetical protein
LKSYPASQFSRCGDNEEIGWIVCCSSESKAKGIYHEIMEKLMKRFSTLSRRNFASSMLLAHGNTDRPTVFVDSRWECVVIPSMV